MSLLNNALREAEERQHRPEVAGAYTGAAQENQSGRRWPVVLIFLLALGLAAAGLYWFAMVDPAAPETSREVSLEGSSLASVENGQVERVTAVGEKDDAVEAVETAKPAERAHPVTEIVETAEPEVVEVAAAPAPVEPVPERKLAESVAPELQVPEPARPKAATAAPEAPEPEALPTQVAPGTEPVVKTTPQTPGAIDRRTSQELEAMIGRGRMIEAERRLASLTQTQIAPLSRSVVARSLLVDGDIARALSWLPQEASAVDANLRMLRARALHADGRLDAAVATLESRLPDVSELPAYRVTLATLLQQQGQGEAAAAQWAELIAWDDSRAPWWVGLAIALEDQGEVRGAARAYQQAAELPGLPPSLADYVQRRLQSLRAG